MSGTLVRALEALNKLDARLVIVAGADGLITISAQPRGGLRKRNGEPSESRRFRATGAPWVAGIPPADFATRLPILLATQLLPAIRAIRAGEAGRTVPVTALTRPAISRPRDNGKADS